MLAFGRILTGLARRASSWSELEAVLGSVPLHQVSGGLQHWRWENAQALSCQSCAHPS